MDMLALNRHPKRLVMLVLTLAKLEKDKKGRAVTYEGLSAQLGKDLDAIKLLVLHAKRAGLLESAGRIRNGEVVPESSMGNGVKAVFVLTKEARAMTDLPPLT